MSSLYHTKVPGREIVNFLIIKKRVDKLKKCVIIINVRNRKENEIMDKRISYKLVIDTETCPINKEVDGVFPSNMWTYDVGWAVVDKRGKVY